jgi:arylsulfatase A
LDWVGKIDSNSTNNNVLVNTDFYNTFLDIAGEKEDQRVESKSFKASLHYPNTVLESKPILWHYPHFSNQLGRPSSAIRVGDWKLIKFYENNRYELYNIKNDQGEKINLASKNLVKTKELKLLLEANLKEMNANMPIEVK